MSIPANPTFPSIIVSKGVFLSWSCRHLKKGESIFFSKGLSVFHFKAWYAFTYSKRIYLCFKTVVLKRSSQNIDSVK